MTKTNREILEEAFLNEVVTLNDFDYKIVFVFCDENRFVWKILAKLDPYSESGEDEIECTDEDCKSAKLILGYCQFNSNLEGISIIKPLDEIEHLKNVSELRSGIITKLESLEHILGESFIPEGLRKKIEIGRESIICILKDWFLNIRT